MSHSDSDPRRLPLDPALYRQFELFLLAWRLVHPNVEEIPNWRSQVVRDALTVGLFSSDPTLLNFDEAAFRGNQEAVAELETLYPDHPFRNLMHHLLDLTEAKLRESKN